ncbi:MAG: DUF4350 domain-containing protein [Proteobacteria bacterium]|nr:DUF4350 domain-containing protein [Pseudomonadota bacterium]
MRRALAIGAILVGLGGSAARAEPGVGAADAGDYDPHSTAWNGMASFVGLAEGMGFEVTPLQTLEWSEVSADDILILIYPLQRVDPARLGAFVTAGGNVVIADDFGEGREAMAALGLLRAEVVAPRATRFEGGRIWAPIATAKAEHPLAAEVGELVTNHPAALTRVQGATVVLGFEEGAVVVAGERGTGRFVAISDPSIFINRMQQFHGDLQFSANLLRWLDRGRRARHVKILRGDVPMFGDPRPYIDDARAGEVGRSVADLNFWLSERREWLLTANAMRGLAVVLALALLSLAFFALPVRRGPKIDGGWLKFNRPVRRDEPHTLVMAHDDNLGSNLVLACVLRDVAQHAIADVTGKSEPLYTVPEAELVALVVKAKGAVAGTALARVYRRLRNLPSRGQAAAPWSAGAGHLPRREFDALYKDVGDLCRTLGASFEVSSGT